MNTKNNNMFKSSSKIITLLIIGLCLLTPIMAFGLDNAKPDSTVRCDMQIIKAVDSLIASPGSILTYTIQVKNLDNYDHENVLVKDGIPLYTTYVQGSADNNGVYSSTYNQIEWEIDRLKAGTTIELSYETQIDADTPDLTEIRNTAKISLPIIVYSNLVITKVKVEAKPKLEIIKQVDKATAFAADTLHYTLTVSNNGDAKAYGVEVFDNIPEFTSYLLGSATNGTYDANFNRIDWYIQYLWPGESVDLNFSAIIDSDTPVHTVITNIGTIIQESGNISDTVETTIILPPAPKLNIIKEVDKSTAYAGDTLSYTLTASNTGDVAAENIELVDNIPEFTAYIPGSSAYGIYDSNNNSLSWLITSLDPGQTVVYSFKASIVEGTPAQTEVENIGYFYFVEEEYADTVKTTVLPSPYPILKMSKYVDKSSAYGGDILTYTLQADNIGDVDDESVTIVDKMPQNTVYISGSVTGGAVYNAQENQIEWSGVISAHSSTGEMTFSVVADDFTPAQTIITNIGSIVFPDSLVSDTAKTTIVLSPEPRLYMEKQVDKSSAYPGDTLTYTLIVWNGSEVTAENINVIDNIPDHTTYVPGTAFGGSYDSGLNQLGWTIESLDSNQEYYLSFRAIIVAGTPEQTVINNIGTVTAPGIPDSDEVQTTVLGYPDPELYIEKQVDKITAYAGDTLTYTLIISNLSAIPAENVNVEDYIPEFTTYVPGTAFGGNYNEDLELLTWTVDYIEAPYPAYLSFRAVIDRDTPDNTDIINTGSVVLPDEKISDDVKTKVLPSPTSELEIIKKVDKATAFAGDTLTYTLDITNIGEETARNIKLEDYIPDFTAYLPGSASNATYDDTNDLLNWHIDYIEPGVMVSRSFKAIIDSDTPVQTEIINTGSIVLPDGKISDDVTTTVLPTPEPEFDIDKNVDKATAFAGDTLTYTVHVSNIGEVSALNVEVEDFIPEYTTYIPVSSSNINYDTDNQRLSWIIENLDPGASSSTSFKVTISESTPSQTEIENIGSILFPDESKLSDTAKTIVQEKPAPKLDITKTVDLATAYAGEILTYMISISNTGDVADEDVWVTDPIPQNATYVDGSVTGGGDYNIQTETVNWNISVPAGGSVSDLTFKVIIDKGTPDQTLIRNIGSILYPDETFQSDTALTTVKVGPSPDLDISKTVDKPTAYAGDTLTYTISVSNSGEAADEAVWVTDPIPQNATYIVGSVTGGGVYDTQIEIIDWNISVPAGGSVSNMTFKVTIEEATPAQTEIENIGSILFPDDSRLSDTAKTIVLETPVPDLEVSKLVDSLIASPGSILTYSLEFTNTGNTAITQITAWDKLPDFTSYVDGSATAGGSYDETDNQVNWDWQVGSIAPGHSIDLSFKVKMDDDAIQGTQITNIGSAALPVEQSVVSKVSGIQYETLDTVHSNPVITVVDIKTGEDDLTIFKEVSDTYTAPGNILTYDLTITNTGSENLNNIVFADTIPTHTEYIPGSATGGAIYDGTDGSLTWTIGSLDQNQAVMYQFNVIVDQDAPDAAIIYNQAFIIEPTTINGNIVTTTILRKHISVHKSVDKDQVTIGDTLTYTITYSNNSLADVDNVIITDTLATGLNYILGSATSGGLYNPINETLVWRIRKVPAGGSGSVSFSVEIDESVPNQSAIENFVIFSGDNIPIDTSNQVIVTVSFPEMVMSKTVDQVIAIPGDTVTYTINSFNDGAGPLNNAVVIDTLPDNFEYVSGTATVNGTSVTVTGTDILTIPVGTMEAGESAEVIYDLAILSSADRTMTHVNSAILRGTNNSGTTLEFGPVQAIVSLQTPRLTITKRAEVTSSIAGSFVPFEITITNNANITISNVIVTDSMSSGFFYVEGSSIIDGAAVSDPTGTNPYYWFVGTINPGQTITLQYIAQLGTSVPSGPAKNTAWAAGTVGGESVRTTNVIARINVITTNIPGAIRGKIIVDCDGDGIADTDSMPTEIDIYLDDGSNSKANEKGMFYFGTVRAGEHLVALDIRDLIDYELAEGQDGSVLVYVHEAGESYVTFRICPAYPKLSITKEAAILPKIKVSKTANLSDSMITDSNTVTINYDILIESSFGVQPGEVVVVDSFPDETRRIIIDDDTGELSDTGKVLIYVIDSPGQKRLTQSVYYSLDELDFDVDYFLTNSFYLEGVVNVESEKSTPVKSSPVELSIGPFNSVAAGEINLKVIAAHFITAKAYLQDKDLPLIADLADSISKYPDIKVKVEGHADYRRIHNDEFPSNWELSTARAKSVVDKFTGFHGIDSSLFKYEGFAATRPIDRGHSEASWWKNRRAEVILSGSIMGGLEFNGDLNQKWRQSTLLELEPTQWDTLLFASDTKSETELINTWEVLITINNIGPGKADKVVIEDPLPIGAIYEEGSTTVNGHEVSAKLDADNNLVIGSGDIPEGNKVEIRYRIRAAEKSTITGGGKAVVEIEHRDIGIVKQESNPIRFY